MTTCEDVARFARDGIHPHIHCHEVGKFCLTHQCADALLWYMLRQYVGLPGGWIASDFDFPCGMSLESSEVECMMSCLDRLGAPVPMTLETSHTTLAGCWDAFINALSKCGNIVKFGDVSRHFSRQELERLLSVMNDKPTLGKLRINVGAGNLDIADRFIKDNTTVHTLFLSRQQNGDNQPGPDSVKGLLANRTLTCMVYTDGKSPRKWPMH